MRHASFAVAALALAGAIAAACSSTTSSNACGSGTPPSAVGTYSLISYTFGGNTVDTTQGASGQLRFHTGTYAFNVTIPVQGAIADSGTYAINGTRCMTETSLMGSGSTTGSFTLSGTTPGSVFSFAGTNTLVGAVGFAGKKQ